MKEDKIIIQKVISERNQTLDTRRDLYIALQKFVKVPVISFFTSFKYPVSIEDNDADILQGVLQKLKLNEGFALFLSSPGGSALAAERIINVCRAYSKTGEYQVIIPGKAKSAATMICLGASKLIMSKTSELGSIDPQVTIIEEGLKRRYSVYNLIKSYENLFKRAVKEKGNLQPYLQQLSHYDERDIAEFITEMKLSNDIVIKALRLGMLSNLNEKDIINKIKVFLTPEEVKVHGRPIYVQGAIDCNLNVEFIEPDSEFWLIVYELFIRLDNLVSNNNIAKCIESMDYSFVASLEG